LQNGYIVKINRKTKRVYGLRFVSGAKSIRQFRTDSILEFAPHLHNDQAKQWFSNNGINALFPAKSYYKYNQHLHSESKWAFLFQVGLFSDEAIPALMNKLIFGRRANDTTLKAFSSSKVTMPGIALAWLMRGLVSDVEIVTLLKRFTFDAHMPPLEWRKEFRKMPKEELSKLITGDVLKCLLMR
jgi:hypothetical protein